MHGLYWEIRRVETSWVSPTYSFTGTLNPSCTADIIMGMQADAYWYAGRFDDWFFDMDSSLTTDDLIDYFNGSLLTNGGDMGGAVDALSVPGVGEFKGNRRCLSNGRNTIYGSGNV